MSDWIFLSSSGNESIIQPLSSVEQAMDSQIRVGPWLVEPRLNIVSRNGTAVRVEPKVMEVLVCLAAHPGEVLYFPYQTSLNALPKKNCSRRCGRTRL